MQLVISVSSFESAESCWKEWKDSEPKKQNMGDEAR